MPDIYAQQATLLAQRIKLMYAMDAVGVPQQVKAAYVIDENGDPQKVFPRTLAYDPGVAVSLSTGKKPGFIWNSWDGVDSYIHATIMAGTNAAQTGYSLGVMGSITNGGPAPGGTLRAFYVQAGTLYCGITRPEPADPNAVFDRMLFSDARVSPIDKSYYGYFGGVATWGWTELNRFDPETGQYIGPLYPSMVSGTKYALGWIV